MNGTTGGFGDKRVSPNRRRPVGKGATIGSELPIDTLSDWITGTWKSN